MLHVTNGDIAAALLSRLFEGEVLAWRDVLHEGPVRAGLSLEQLSEERARFIAQAGWAPLDEVESTFRNRDARLARSRSDGEVVLWFEHDLYDQLQLIQVLDWLAAHPHPRVALICEAQYVSEMPPGRMRELFAARKPVTAGEFADARRAWSAFTGADPSAIPTQSGALRFLGQALRRQLQEFPWTTDGLSLLERRVLDLVEESGPLPWAGIFSGIEEDPKYLGDAVLRWHLERMESEGLLARRGERYELVSRKRKKRLPRWLGGVRVDDGCRWRWDPNRNGVRPYLASH